VVGGTNSTAVGSGSETGIQRVFQEPRLVFSKAPSFGTRTNMEPSASVAHEKVERFNVSGIKDCESREDSGGQVISD
jgi:hypothetical protein